MQFEMRQPPREPAFSAVVRRMADRDQAAATELYDATCHQVFGLALRILRDRAAAEDITIEVYTQAWNQAPSFDPSRGSPLGWLMTLPRTRALDAFRARRRDAATDTLDVVENKECDRPGPEAVTLEVERNRLVSGALARLSEDQREAIQLAYFKGLSHSQIASSLGQLLGTVKTRIRQGMIQLRELLGQMAPAAAVKGMP